MGQGWIVVIHIDKVSLLGQLDKTCCVWYNDIIDSSKGITVEVLLLTIKRG